MDIEKIKQVLSSHRRWIDGHKNAEKADLRRANLSEANLKIFQAGLWTAYISPTHIMIGCHLHSVSDWRSFSDKQIEKMSDFDIDYWRENKCIIFAISESIQSKQEPAK